MSTLPYAQLKSILNGPKGMNYIPFFGRYARQAAPGDFRHYRYVLDTIDGKLYDHPTLNTNGLIAPAPYYLCEGVQYSVQMLDQFLRRHEPQCKYIHATVAEGPMLVIMRPGDAETAGAIYKTWASRRASRPVVDSDRQVHWVWFRRGTYKLTEEVVLRAASWIELNPGYTFHLWTNLADDAERDDFLSELPAELRNAYFASNRIQVHYNDDFRGVVFDWLGSNMPFEVSELYARVWVSQERQDTIMKTDYSRVILLAARGGIYTDFNDLVCLEPVEPLLEVHAGDCFGVMDDNTLNSVTNYFMYAGADCAAWKQYVKECVGTLPKVYGIIYSPRALELARAACATMLNGDVPPPHVLEEGIRCGFEGRFDGRHFARAIAFGIMHSFPQWGVSQLLLALWRRTDHGRMKPSFAAEVATLLKTAATDLEPLLQTEQFESVWRLGWMDIFLNPIMHHTNLPIYCRSKDHPLYSVPYGYLYRYCGMLSFVGHISDGGSYGVGAQRPSIKSYFA